MCTLVVAANVVPGFPLLVVANRDEQKGRASSPPRIWSDKTHPEDRARDFVAPRDEVAGGTWLGVNKRGVFVAITNRFLGPHDPLRVSRGQIVVNALACDSAHSIRAMMTKVDPKKHSGFHLVYADASDVLASISDGATMAHLALGDGLSVVTERSFGRGDADDGPRLKKITSRFNQIMSDKPFDAIHMTKLLADHDAIDPFGATCIHVEEIYGTRSSMVLTRSAAGGGGAGAFRMFWAEGPPCTTPFHEIPEVAALI